MKNRLEVARDLMHKNGFLFLNIDDIEFAYLKVLCDEIFDKSLFVNSIAVRSSTASGMKTAHRDKKIIKQKDLILVYKKNPDSIINPQYQKKEKWDNHYNYFFDYKTKEIKKLKDILIESNIIPNINEINNLDINSPKFKKFYIENANFIFQTAPELPKEIKEKSKKNRDNVIEYKDENGNSNYAINGRRMTFLSKLVKELDGKKELSTLLCDFWNDIDYQNTQNEGGIDLSSGKKPEFLLKRIINMTTQENDIILDFFLGSGTTAAVAHKLCRQYIGVEQLDYGNDDSVIRLVNVINDDKSGITKSVNWKGGGEFIFLELKKYNQAFIEKIESAKDTKALLKIWEEMKERSFLNYNVDLKKMDEHLKEFKTLSLEEQKQHLVEILDKNQLYVNLSSMNDKDFKVTKEEKKLTKDFYKIN